MFVCLPLEFLPSASGNQSYLRDLNFAIDQNNNFYLPRTEKGNYPEHVGYLPEMTLAPVL